MHPDRIVLRISVFLFVLMLPVISGFDQLRAQESLMKTDFEHLFDSIDNRIAILQQQVSQHKKIRDASYYNLQRELDLTLFVRTYEEHVMEEKLDEARELVETELEGARFRKDKYSESFLKKYEDKVYRQLKQQRMYYQDLLAKEKKFKKAYLKIVKPRTLKSYQKADRMIRFALKYANENNFQQTASYLNRYLIYNQSFIYNYNTTYDLAKLTAKEKNFEKIFNPLVESDSIKDIKEAEDLLNKSRHYSKLTRTALDSAYFEQQNLVIATALSDILRRQGREKELEKYTDQAVKAKLDTLNPAGVFKWNEYVVVIDEFVPKSSFENVKKGEAIIHADNMLATYLNKNKLCKSISELKFGYAFIIPYQSNVKNSVFYHNKITGKWQYIACYTAINSETYTKNVSKFMPPIYFENNDKADLGN